MTEPTPPKKHLEQQPGETIWEAAARELVRNPNSPASLKIMSSVGNALKPRAEAVAQVEAALVAQMEKDGQIERAALQAALEYWQRVSGGPMRKEQLQDLKKSAAHSLEQRRSRPPQMREILTSWPQTTDVGYHLGVHLEGLEGTWHRLWAIVVLTLEWEPDVGTDHGVRTVRSQFEDLIGRPMSAEEWGALVERARRFSGAKRPG